MEASGQKMFFCDKMKNFESILKRFADPYSVAQDLSDELPMTLVRSVSSWSSSSSEKSALHSSWVAPNMVKQVGDKSEDLIVATIGLQYILNLKKIGHRFPQPGGLFRFVFTSPKLEFPWSDFNETFTVVYFYLFQCVVKISLKTTVQFERYWRWCDGQTVLDISAIISGDMRYLFAISSP